MRFSRWMLLALLLAGTAFAQQGPPAGARGAGRPAFQALKNYLSLTDAQVTNLTAVETALREALKPLHQDLLAKRQALFAENQKTTPDPNVVAQLKQDIANLLTQIQDQRSNYQKQALAYLNPDQLDLLAKLNDVLKLMPVARAAAALDLITPPDGMGMRMAGAGRGLMMRRPRTN